MVSLLVLIGPQAVGKMTIGEELSQMIDGKLLYNHQTIDFFATYLGYTAETFRLSDELRKQLFRGFVANTETNPTKTIIFTVVINFDAANDRQFLQEVAAIFLQAGQEVYLAELTATLATRLKRNVSELRLQKKPSKRDLAFSRQELLSTHQLCRLESKENEVTKLIPKAEYVKIDTTNLTPQEAATKIKQIFFIC